MFFEKNKHHFRKTLLSKTILRDIAHAAFIFVSDKSGFIIYGVVNDFRSALMIELFMQEYMTVVRW